MSNFNRQLNDLRDVMAPELPGIPMGAREDRFEQLVVIMHTMTHPGKSAIRILKDDAGLMHYVAKLPGCDYVKSIGMIFMPIAMAQLFSDWRVGPAFVDVSLRDFIFMTWPEAKP